MHGKRNNVLLTQVLWPPVLSVSLGLSCRPSYRNKGADGLCGSPGPQYCYLGPWECLFSGLFTHIILVQVTDLCLLGCEVMTLCL